MGRFFGAIGRCFREADKWLLLFSMLAAGYGLLLLLIAIQAPDMQSGNSPLFSVGGMIVTRQFLVQFVSVALGVTAALLLSRIHYEIIAACWWVITAVAVILVVLTYFIGMDTGAADDKAWLRIPFINATFQPSELLKIAYIITFSIHLSRTADHLNEPLNLILICVHALIPMGMIVLQGDDGTALVFGIIFLMMAFTAGVKLRYFIIGGSALLIAAPFAWVYLLTDDKRARFLTFLHPETDRLGDGYQQFQARMMIGSGGVAGKGIRESGNILLPERENDFIFSVAGEAFGFIGVVLLIGILVALMVRVFSISMNAKDMLGSLMCMGVFATIAAQTIMNLGMNLCLLPVVGVTLPFFSAGGSSATTLFLGIGIVLSVCVNSRPRTQFERVLRR